MRFLLACGLAAAAPSLARAEPALRAPGTAVPGDLVVSSPTGGAFVLARQLVPATAAAEPAQRRVIYLNRTGIIVTPGVNDSRTDRSSIVDAPRSIPAWTVSAARWSATKACLTDMFSRFDVTVTDEDPGAVPHIEAVIGGAPQDLGMPANVGGVSPFAVNCSVIESSIVFTFASVLADDAQRVCEVTAQEIAHSYGLDHELLAPDPMTYLGYTGKRRFQDQSAPCGESTARPCGIGNVVCRDRQNSVALLEERLGVSASGASRVTITAPADGATVAPAFTVSATASDDVRAEQAMMYLDGAPVATLPGPGPFVFLTPALMPVGPHTIDVAVSDGQRAASATIHVTVRSTSGDGGGAAAEDAGDDPGLGCSTTGGTDAAAAAPLLVVVLHRRRRSAARSLPGGVRPAST